MKKCFLNWAFRVVCLFLSISLVYADDIDHHVTVGKEPITGRKPQTLTITSGDVMNVDNSLAVVVEKRYQEDTGTLSYSIKEVDEGAAFVDDDGLIVAINSGTVMLTVASLGDANHAPVSASQLITIRKGEPDLSITSPNTVVFADSVYLAANTTATYERGGAISFKVIASGSGSATIDPSTGLLIAKAAGTVTVVAKSAGDADYSSSTVSQVLNIFRRTPSLKINWGDMHTFTVDNTVLVRANTTAATGRGGPIHFSVLAGSGSATVNPSTGVIAPIEVGTVIVIAKSVGDLNYNPVEMRQEVTIGPSSPTLTIKLDNKLDVEDTLIAKVVTTATKRRGGPIRFSITPGTGNAEVDPETGFIRATKAGTVVLTVRSEGDRNYHGASTRREFTIGQNTPMLDITSADHLRVGDVSTVNVVSSAGLKGGAIRFAIEAGSGSATVDSNSGLVTAIGAGTVTLVASSAGSWNYASNSVRQGVVIGKGKPTLTIVSVNTLHVDGTLTAEVKTTATDKRGGAVHFSIVRGEGTGYAEVDQNTGVIKGITAGTVLLEATCLGDTDYTSSSSRQWLTIGRSTPVLTVQAVSKVYVDDIFRVNIRSSATYGLGGAIQYTIEAGTGLAAVDPDNGLITAIEAGTVYLVARSEGDNDYAPVSVKKEIEILPSTPILTVELTNKLDVDHTANIMVSTSATNGRGGSIRFSITSGEGDGYAKVDPKTGVIEAITAGKVLLVVTAEGDSNYNLASTSQWLTISQNTPMLTIELASSLNVDKTLRARVVSTAAYGLGGAIKYAIVAGSGSATVNADSGLITAIGAGTVTLIARSEGDWDYVPVSISQEITIGKSTPVLMISAVSGLRVDETLAAMVTTTAKRGGGSIRFSIDKSVSDGYAEVDEHTGVIKAITAGKVLLTASSEGDGNYGPAKTSRWIAIGQNTPELAILLANKLGVDGAVRLQIASSATPGLGGALSFSLVSIGGGSATLNLRTGWLTAISAGTVTLIVTSEGDLDYTPASVEQDIVIGPGNPFLAILSSNTLAVDGSLAVKAMKRASGDIGTLRYSIMNGDGSASVDEQGMIKGIATGFVTLTVESLGNANYAPATVSQLITIKKCTPTLTIESGDTMRIGDSLKVSIRTTARNSHGGKVSFRVSGGSGSATIDPDTGVLKAVGAGLITLTASSLGDANYKPVATYQVITIEKIPQVLTITSPNALVVDGSLEVSAHSNVGDGQVIRYSILKGNGSAFLSGSKNLLRATHYGTVILTASSLGNAYYAPAKTHQVILIGRGKPLLTINAPSLLAIGQSVVATVKSSATYRRGGITRYAIEAGSGSATVNPVTGAVSAVGAGTVTLVAKTLGDADYEVASTSQVITIGEVVAWVDTAADIMKPVEVDSFSPIGASVNSAQVSEVIKISDFSKGHLRELSSNSFFNEETDVSAPVIVEDGVYQDIRIPKAYSPNNDGINDLFRIENIAMYPNNSFVIAAERGKEVFNAKGYNNETIAFTGKCSSGAELPEGQYFYRLVYDQNGEQKEHSGFFKLAR